ncbi:hypothetical protein MG293_010326 [Ovis ammon polii]|uniref:UPAR/Ly6 domain-containing protein n=1 Tax=Ovis ammon polii TaxID=230172 RepID=A0AAD4U641_OVIAM|nr:hypothetical protein MG293_010326 [Ovis ammon polii]
MDGCLIFARDERRPWLRSRYPEDWVTGREGEAGLQAPPQSERTRVSRKIPEGLLRPSEKEVLKKAPKGLPGHGVSGPGITGNDNPPCFASGLGPAMGGDQSHCVWKTRTKSCPDTDPIVGRLGSWVRQDTGSQAKECGARDWRQWGQPGSSCFQTPRDRREEILLTRALQCEPLVECAPPDKYCVITRAASPGGVLVMKSCAPTCPNSTVTSDGLALSVSCCRDNQCSSSAATGLLGGPGAMSYWITCPSPDNCGAHLSAGTSSIHTLAPRASPSPVHPGPDNLVNTLLPAQALRCHVCSSSSNCKKPQVCLASSSFCKTVIRVEPLSGNLVEKNCSEWCTPTNGQQGQVSKGQETTLCCKGDLCNEGLQSWQSAAPSRTSAHLGLALACGLLALLWAPGL